MTLVFSTANIAQQMLQLVKMQHEITPTFFLLLAYKVTGQKTPNDLGQTNHAKKL